ncbi:MAG TPA: BatA domain-containing protein [Chthoniobacteraceae bacterium]|nr:BatA domain-containing protein [Chthoniobacteraceae bacterium]
MPTLLSPAIWYAGAAVLAAPIAIHLLNRMRVKIIHWGAMKFLLESIRKNQRRLRIEDLLLLLMRCAIIALLAYAFGRPVINPNGAGAASTSGPTIAVFIVDQTASMGQSNGVNTRYELAKTEAGKMLDNLPSSSQVALFFSTDHLVLAVPRPVSNLPLVRRIIDASNPSYRTGDLLPAIQQALNVLHDYSGTRKEIDIFTDNQALAWKQLDQIKPLVAGASEVNFNLVPLGSGAGEDNLAITAIKPQASIPAAGEDYDVVVEVSNFTSAPVSGVHVTLAMDDQQSATEGTIEGEIPPGKTGGVRLDVKFTQAGYHTLTAAIPADHLAADNERAIAVQVIDQMHVAIVEGTQPTRSFRDGFFIENALAPVASTHLADYYLKPDMVTSSWLEDGDFSKDEIIFLANVGDISTNAAQKLQKYVQEGGALVIFPGPNTHTDSYNTELKDILPATFGSLRDLTKPRPGSLIKWQVSNYPHQITSLWNDSTYTSLGSVETSIYYPLYLVQTKDKADAPLPIVNYQDNTPAAAERIIGKGHVIMFSSAADSRWSYFVLHPDFLPFMNRLVAHVSKHENPEKLTVAPGSPFDHPVNADMVGHEYSVIRPDSKGKPVLGGKVEFLNRQAVVRYTDTEVAGAYRVLVAGSDLPVAAFAVQMDAHESDLHPASSESLAFLNKGGQNVASSPTLESQPAGGIRRELWGYMVMIAAIIAVVEMLLAHKFSLAK